MTILNHTRKLSVSEMEILKRALNKGINENYVSLSDFRTLSTSDNWFEIDVMNLVDDGLLVDYKDGFYNLSEFGKEFAITL